MKTNVHKIAKEIARLNDIEISELTGILLNEHNISVTMYRFTNVGGSGYKTEKYYDVKLDYVPRNKLLAAVKITKEMLGLGLKDAKTIVDSRPCMLKEFATAEEAEALEKAFDEIDADLEIEPVG